MADASGRLTSRPGPAGGDGPPPGLHPLEHGALLVVPPGPPAPRPLLVFFHGAGGSARHSLALVQDAVAAAGVLALLPSSVRGTWDLISGGLGEDVARLDAALAEVFAESPVDRVALAGFSDGASYALSLGLANGDLVEALLAFSPGFVAPALRQGRPRVWVAHDTRDQVLPVDRCGRRVVRVLRSAGHEVSYEEFDGPHVVRPQDLDAALAWWLAGSGHAA